MEKLLLPSGFAVSRVVHSGFAASRVVPNGFAASRDVPNGFAASRDGAASAALDIASGDGLELAPFMTVYWPFSMDLRFDSAGPDRAETPEVPFRGSTL